MKDCQDFQDVQDAQDVQDLGSMGVPWLHSQRRHGGNDPMQQELGFWLGLGFGSGLRLGFGLGSVSQQLFTCVRCDDIP